MKRVVMAMILAAVPLTPAAAQPLAAAHPAAQSQAQPPTETPASRQAMRLLKAFTAGDEASFLATIHDIDPKSRRSDAEWLSVRSNLDKLQFHALAAATATHAELSVFDPNLDDWARLVVDVKPDAPYTLAGMGMRRDARPADVPAPPKLQPAALVAATRAQVAADVAAGGFDGAVLIAKDGRPLLDAAYGLADRETKTPNTVETQFRFGSMGKMFTMVAILQLAQAGKLDLTAPIGRYLPDYPNAEIAQKVTVDNLLTHTGGTGDIFGPEFNAHRLELKEPKDYVALYGARAPLFPGGQSQAYSNYGFMLLGRIVEAASGQSYDAYVQAHIFAPAHMTSTGAQPETVKLPKRAVAYMGPPGKLQDAAETLPVRGTPAGGGYSTVGDMLAFANALMADKLLDAAHLKLLTLSGGMKLTNGAFVRYDFGGPSPDGRRVLGHAGGAPGMNGVLNIYPDDGYVVVVLANRDGPAATRLAKFIGDRLP
jgi:CubicO group peptidase (beta-lactamase class C family)